ncbi:MAG: S8 family serine peptidase [Candidatus Eisenbacteria bacterium]|nr:S8 family serine peptidase [Candidatus Eisenbacteria bacterium]
MLRINRITILALGMALWAALLPPSAAQAANGDLASATREANHPAKLWVFFEDKGFERGGERAAIEAFRSGLPERALARRARVGFELNVNDLPVADDYVDAIRATGADVVVRSRWLNAVSVLADEAQAARIAGLPFVRDMRPVASGVKELPVITPADDGGEVPTRGRLLDYGDSFQQLDMMQVPDLHDEGYDGAGVIIAMLDTGFDTDHQAYRHLDILAERDFINNDTETADQPGDPSGQDGHGTATLSCVGARYPGEVYGGSYNASFVLCKTEIVDDEIEVEEDYWVAATEFADSLGADVISSSLGYYYWYTYEDMDGNTALVTIAADMAAARGIVVVNSMGNEGDDPWRYMIAPADGDSVLSVGAVTSEGVRTDFSSVGPTYDGRIKPDVMAMGQSTYIVTTADTASYGRASGTSFSCPLTAGAVGLLVQGHTDWSPVDIIDALRSTATQSGSPDTLMGWGIVRAREAMYSDWQGVEAESVRSGLVRTYPNPVAKGTNVSYSLPRDGRARLAVYDPSGRLVRVLSDLELSAGDYSVKWDSRDEKGMRVAGGVYFVRLTAGPGVVSSAKVVLVR